MTLSEQEQAQQELENLRKATTKFYTSKAGKRQLKWLADFEARMVEAAIKSTDKDVQLSCLNQLKGLRTFKDAYLDTLIIKD